MLLAASLTLSLQPWLGASHNDLSWNIAQDLSGTLAPNVLSELTFEDVRAYQVGLAGDLRAEFFRPDLQLLVEGEASLASIERGTSTDADFLRDNRALIGSLSKADIEGDEAEAWSAGIGFSYALVPDAHIIGLIAGAYRQDSDINFRNGRQLIVNADFIPGVSIDALTRNLQQRLDSNYLAEWSGSWVAGQYEFRRQDWSLHLRYQQYRGDYYGEGRWNLRAEGRFPLQQPRSFSHDADSAGESWEVELEYRLGERSALHVQWAAGEWDTGRGLARIFFADGTVARTRLNEAEQSSSEIRIGLSYVIE
ncbi:hypothetical protein F6455_09500 [Proteobacteria bacterium 005FR1]|nr:hypothetical protein [Proteobacteria bacterium 005FR1]